MLEENCWLRSKIFERNICSKVLVRIRNQKLWYWFSEVFQVQFWINLSTDPPWFLSTLSLFKSSFSCKPQPLFPFGYVSYAKPPSKESSVLCSSLSFSFPLSCSSSPFMNSLHLQWDILCYRYSGVKERINLSLSQQRKLCKLHVLTFFLNCQCFSAVT